MIKRIGISILAILFLSTGLSPVHAQFNSLLRKANKEYELQAFNLAIESYLKALRERRTNVEALTKLADCYRITNQMEQSASAYSKAAEQKSFPEEKLLYYGLVLKAVENYPQAKQVFQEFSKKSPDIGKHFVETCDFAIRNNVQDPTYQVVLSSVSSDASDFGPAIVEDGVVFSSARLDVTRSTSDWTGKAQDQLFLSRLDPTGSLGAPMMLRSGQPDAYHDGPASFAPNGRAVAYTKNNFVNGTRHIPASGMKLDLYLSQLDAGKQWKGEFPFAYNGNNYSTGFPAFSPDGTSLYFASDRPGGFGGYDIYVTVWNGESFDPPQNLGSAVNTIGNEIAPFFDGAELYFSSDFHPGFGGYDVFRCSREGSGWTEAENLKKPVNSSYDDYGYVADASGKQGYLVSNRKGGRGKEDIYQVFSSRTGVTLQVNNASNGQPIPGATLDFTSCNKGTFTTDPRGQFIIRTQSGLSCQLEVRAPGYLSRQLPLSALVQGGAQPIVIDLIRNGELAEGRVTDGATGAPLSGVQVEVVNLLTQSRSTTATDNLGMYRTALQPTGQYELRFAVPGYQNLTRRVQTGQFLDPNVLGTAGMLRMGATPGGVGGTLGPPTGGAPATQTGYAIQVAALKVPVPSRFKALEQYGSIYNVQEGNLYKVRLGVYATKAEADRLLSQVKAKGFSKAFVVEETSGPQSRSGSNPVLGPPSAGTQPTNTQLIGRYHIQLAAYSNAGNFKRTKVEGLGVITQLPKGNLTVMYLSSFDDINTARSVLARAKQAGFSGAYIVENQGNGSVKRVN